MTVIVTRIKVAEDGTISGRVPSRLPAGEHEARIVLGEAPVRRKPAKRFDVSRLPRVHLGPWPQGMSLRREDIYGDDGR